MTDQHSTSEIINHPVRARILVGLMGRELTTRQIARLLPGVPRASLYRQVRRLLDAGLLEVVREVPVRGTLEKVYGVRRDAGQIPAGESAPATADEHLRTFTAFLGTLTTAYRAYLEAGVVDHPAQVTMVATPIYADDAEYARFRDGLRRLIDSFPRKEPTEGGGARRILWVASVPDPSDAGTP